MSKNFRETLIEQLSDPEFKAMWDAGEAERGRVRAQIESDEFAQLPDQKLEREDMTNYEAILRMMPKQMERFLDQVYLAGLNTGMYAAKHDDDRVLDDNPFDTIWLAAEAEKATAVGFADDGDEYMLNALTVAVLRSAGICQQQKPQASESKALHAEVKR